MICYIVPLGGSHNSHNILCQPKLRDATVLHGPMHLWHRRSRVWRLQRTWKSQDLEVATMRGLKRKKTGENILVCPWKLVTS